MKFEAKALGSREHMMSAITRATFKINGVSISANSNTNTMRITSSTTNTAGNAPKTSIANQSAPTQIGSTASYLINNAKYSVNYAISSAKVAAQKAAATAVGQAVNKALAVYSSVMNYMWNLPTPSISRLSPFH